METYLFILFATLAVASAVAMITSKHTVNSALFLVLNLISIAGIFLLLKAQFLAVIQILVYAGAIMVLFLFVIMLLNLSEEEDMLSRISTRYFVAFLLGVFVLAQLMYAVADAADVLPLIAPEMEQVGTVEALGDSLFTTYLLPVLMTAILLTAAIVGALLISQHKPSEKNK
ncbi:MAG: NADH-quinone oxidoreductase subunit J [Balneolales bacterium]